MRRILLIEDETPIADTIIYALESEGFSVYRVSEGEKGLLSLREEDFDLIVLDVGLPDVSGFEVARRIRTESTIPIIFLTARAEEVDRIVGLEIGADDYIVKPFSPRELTARVRAVLRRIGSGTKEQSHGAVTPEVSAAGFFIDDLRFQIFFEGQPLPLSRYEYRLLEVLIRCPGQVFSRERLMNLAWETPEMSMERTVDTHIKTIRKKLRDIRPDEEIVITHRGIGYSLKEGL